MIVFYEITRACDLVCLHCRACAQVEPDANELSTAQSQHLIDQLAAFPNPPLLVLTGGDPLKRADIYDLISYAVDAGLEVAATPSATPLVTTDAIRRLRDAGIARLAISIDGADDETHDTMRGVRGSFQRAMEIMTDARDLGVPVQVNTTMTPNNLDQVDEMAGLLARHEIVLWSVFFLVPVGRAVEEPRLTAEQYEAVFEQLWQQSRRQPFAIKTTEAPHYRRYVLQQREASSDRLGTTSARDPRYGALGLNDGKGIMFVGHNGLIHPSGFMPIVCGAFPLDDVVQVYQQNTVFQGLRDAKRLEGKCGRCEYRTICGGSRARSFALTGDPYAEEPDCVYIPPQRSAK